MDLKYGSYQALETALADYLSGAQTSVSDKVLVVTPSGVLSSYLKASLTGALGGTQNVFFNKFSSLLHYIEQSSGYRGEPLLSSGAVQEFVLKNVLESFGVSAARGVSAGYRAALRDMADAMIDPEIVREHAKEGAFGQGADKEYILELLRVYDRYNAALSGVKGHRSYREFFDNTASLTPQSAYLKGFKKIIFYGFYEFTARQLEFFNIIKNNFDTALFFLYTDIPAGAYNKKFFETNILGAAKDAESLPLTGGAFGADVYESLFLPSASVKDGGHNAVFFNAADAEGELYFICKELLRLRAKGVEYGDMAVITRAQEPYRNILLNIFEQNKIPVNAVEEQPLLTRPLAVFCYNILFLAVNNFQKEQLFSIVSSPYFKIKNNWCALVAATGAERDFEQWQYMLSLNKSEDAPEFAAWLSYIKELLGSLDGAESFAALARRAREILREFILEEDLTQEEQGVLGHVRALLEEIKKYDLVLPRARKGEFLDELDKNFKSARVNNVSSANGVYVSDISKARGQSFKVVFLTGVNEGSFPPAVREDPVLKDSYRKVLRDVQGFWINPKTERHEEEKMLFFISLAMARERIYISYRRGGEGNGEIKSLYLFELERALAAPAVYIEVPAKETEKYFSTEEELLSEQEFSIKTAALRQEDKYARAGIDASGTESNFKQASVMRTRGALTPYDGVMSGGAAEVFGRINARGFSPSGLKNLAECPMKYLFSNVFSLSAPPRALTRAEVPADAQGRFYHKVLETMYKNVPSKTEVPAVLDAALEEAFKACGLEEKYKEFGVYPVLWRVISGRIKATLSAFKDKDLGAMGPYWPAYFELETPAVEYAARGKTLRFHGTIDRIDLAGKTYRVIDYKKKKRGSKNFTSKDIFKYSMFQPFVYLLIAASLKETAGLTADTFAFFNIEDDSAFMQTFSAGDFEEIKEKFDGYLVFLADLVKQGKFFLCAGEHCAFCPYGEICRKGEANTSIRAGSAPLLRDFERWKDEH